MTPELWQRVDEIFLAVIELTPEARSAFMDEACSGNPELRRELESLITADEQGLSFIDGPAFEVAAGLLADEKSKLLSGQHLSHYEIVELLGHGGMGEVYIARDTKLNRLVALKLLPEEYTKDESRLRRFQQEAQAASALNHPNILTIYELGEADEQQFIAAEFIAGETLRQRLGRGKTDLSEALEIAIQIANALAAAHDAGIVHRDIKPENIMLRLDGYVKILDFGLAKLIAEPVNKDFQAETNVLDVSSGVLMGTARYMSPEQARLDTVDARSDIFSFGVVLYEMLAGCPPFNGGNLNEVTAAILNGEPRRLVDVSDRMTQIIYRALRKNKDDRYQSARELLIDLKCVRKYNVPVSSAYSTAYSTKELSPSTGEMSAVPSPANLPAGETARPWLKYYLTLAGTLLVGGALILGLYRLTKSPRTDSSTETTTVNLSASAGPWLGSLNPAYLYTWNRDYSPPAIVRAAGRIPFVEGANITVTYIDGTFTGDGGMTFFDAAGSTVPTNDYDGFNGRFPAYYMGHETTVYEGEVVGAFADNGIIVGTPFPIGKGPVVLTIPSGATELMMGLNDNRYGDNTGTLRMSVTYLSPAAAK